MLERPKKLNVTTHKEQKHFKVSIVGDSGCGKSSFIYRVVQGGYKEFQSTLGVDSSTKLLEAQSQNKVNVTFWDFGGRADFLEIRKEFYKESDVVAIFIDLSTKSSADNLDSWFKEVKESEGNVIILVGAKSDIKRIEGEKLARDRAVNYVDTSAKTGEGVDLFLKRIASEIK